MPNYIKNPEKSGRQVPGPLSDQYYGKATTPLSCSFTRRPNSILIGDTITGNIGFFLGSSASFSSLAGTGDSGNLASGSSYTNFGTLTAGTKLNIHPCAWSGSAANVNKVVFIYNGGLDGSIG